MLVTIKRIFFLPNIILFTLLFLFLISFTPLLAADVLTNPSFTDNITGWTPTITSGTGSITYDSTVYQDTAGSIKGQSPGRNSTTQGYAEQTISTTIAGGSTVNLSFYWSKQCVLVNCNWNYIYIDIAQGAGAYQEVWSETATNPAFGARTAFALVSDLNLSSYFTTTDTYKIRLRFDLRTGNNGSAEANAWFDNMNLDVTPPYVTTGTTGTQVTTVNTGETGKYIGGAFTMVANTGSINVNSIMISEAGTLNANTYLHNVKLFYETAGTCTYDGAETQYGSTTSFSSSEDATFTSTIAVTTSQVCFYVVFDIDQNATDNATILIEINHPPTDVTVDSGYASLPASTVSISGTTTVSTVASVSIALTTDGSVSWGIMEAGTTKNTITITDTQTVRSDSNVNIDLNVKSTNATGGSIGWTLGSDAGTDIFVYEHSSNSGSVWNKFLIADSYYSFVSAMIPDSTQNIDLQITVPTVSSEFNQKTITVTIQAVQSS